MRQRMMIQYYMHTYNTVSLHYYGGNISCNVQLLLVQLGQLEQH